MLSFKGKTIQSTGGRDGIDGATCHRFAMEGTRVIVSDHDAEPPKSAAKTIRILNYRAELPGIDCVERSQAPGQNLIGRLAIGLRAMLVGAVLALALPAMADDLPNVQLVPVLDGLDAPIFLTAPDDGPAFRRRPDRRRDPAEPGRQYCT